MKYHLCTLAVALLLPLAAQAGKEERDFMNGTVEPALKEATAALKKNCGAEVKFDVKDSLKSKDDLFTLKHFAEGIAKESGKYCSDKESKAAIAKLKTIEYARTAETGLQVAGGKAVVTTDGSSNVTWEMLAKALDK
jgi:hypothetical protein